ncbi:hypothetical protein H257_14643 [Aphanomyces astaci]|uniref:Integrase catalytic domain-containing protein n=1 Tax=Aphanomyces astaci TaxID=112090 RepID=W4FRQ0_APHAT|nr:hypothetical protein H257_14643 [Aphanomyces astaci]ETV69621.1 hypothetical protein H257_14643 [Aphanomyces astaci]|eukprot:XP_009840837.1 hypothetical protein H257_14643 [Aphanomyces astaci]
MSAVFKTFNEMLGQEQIPTLAYRPQANGQTERIIQPLTVGICSEHNHLQHTTRDPFRSHARVGPTNYTVSWLTNHSYEVWLLIDQVDAGAKKKLAHLWQHESRPTELVEGIAPIAFDVEMILDDGDYDDAEDEPPDNSGNPGNPALPGNPGNVEEVPVPAAIAVPAANTSNPTAPKSITTIKDDRMIEHQTRPWQKQYEVQLEGSDQWVWVSEHAMPATPLLYEFERGRKNFDLLAEMVLGKELRVEPELRRVDADEELATPELEIDPVPRDHTYEDEEKE